jgi:hypothetical protein
MVKAQTYFPSSIALLKEDGFRMKGARLVRRKEAPVDYFDTVEFQWSSVTGAYYVNLGVIVPRLSDAFGFDQPDPFSWRHWPLGGHRLGDQQWPRITPNLVPQRFGQSPASDVRMRSLLETEALPWFEDLVLSELARGPLMWPPESFVLLHILGERDASAAIARQFEDSASDPQFTEMVAVQAARGREAIDFLEGRALR